MRARISRPEKGKKQDRLALFKGRAHLCSDGCQCRSAVRITNLAVLLRLSQNVQQHLVVGHVVLGVPARGGCRRGRTLLHLLELPASAEQLVLVDACSLLCSLQT